MAMCVHRKMHRNVCLFHISHYRNCMFRRKKTDTDREQNTPIPAHSSNRTHTNTYTQGYTPRTY